MKDLAGKHAFVTGSASGIGLGIARALARAKVDVAMADIDEDRLKAAVGDVAALGVRAEAYPLDVSDRAAVYAARDQVRDDFGSVHILVNNAGVAVSGIPLDQVEDAEYDWIVGVNIMGVFHGTKAFVPLLEAAKGGHIVNTASIGGLRVGPDWNLGLYSATKFAVVAYSEGLRHDLARLGIGVSVLCPGAVNTNILKAGLNRPARFGGAYENPYAETLATALDAGMTGDEIGGVVVQCIRDDEFYILPHPATRAFVEERNAEIMAAYDRAEARQAR